MYSVLRQVVLGLASHALAAATVEDETAFMQTSPAKATIRSSGSKPTTEGNKMTPNPSMDPAPCTDIANITMQKWIDLGYGLLFIHIPKNAGTTVEDAFDIYSERHVPAKMFQDCGFKDTGLKMFTTLRNPYDRAVSAYNMWLSMARKATTNDFDSFVNDLTVFDHYLAGRGVATSVTRQVDCLTGWDYENLVHLHLPVAYLNAEWINFQKEMKDELGISLPDLPEEAVNVADPHPEWCFYYEDRALADAILEYYLEDFLYMNLTTDISHYCGKAGSHTVTGTDPREGK